MYRVVAATPSPTPVPLAVLAIDDARVVEGGSKIDVVFSHSLSIALELDGPCDDIVVAESLSTLGTNATCRMRNDKVIGISFGTDPTITIGSDIKFANITYVYRLDTLCLSVLGLRIHAF